jgi:ubiquinone/menaquinone biosynthesis C-methylase UbiE
MKKLALAGGAALVGYSLWWRKNPSACPYGQRFWVEAPHPFITRERLFEALEPQADQRVLEVGPGTGYYALPVAERVRTLELLDVQKDFLDHTLRRAREQGLDNLVPTEADAREMPYEDDRFDAAYLVTVLGEVPDQDQALRELARVVKPGGRVVVGELFGDPHWVSPKALKGRGERAGLRYDTRLGPPFGAFTRFYLE